MMPGRQCLSGLRGLTLAAGSIHYHFDQPDHGNENAQRGEDTVHQFLVDL